MLKFILILLISAASVSIVSFSAFNLLSGKEELKIELKEKWENVGLLHTTIGFKENVFIDICPSIKDYSIYGSFVVADKNTNLAMKNYYVKYEKPKDYEFKVGKIKTGKPRVEISVEDFEEVNRIDEFPYSFYFIVKVKDYENEGELSTTKITFVNEEGKYFEVNLTPRIHKPGPTLFENPDRRFQTFLMEDNFYYLTVGGGCGPFLYPWEGKVEITLEHPDSIIIEPTPQNENVVGNKVIVSLRENERKVVEYKVRFKEFGNFTLKAILKWGNNRKEQEIKFEVVESEVI